MSIGFGSMEVIGRQKQFQWTGGNGSQTGVVTNQWEAGEVEINV